MTNLAHQFVLAVGKDIAGAKEEYDGCCIDFAGDFLDHLGRGRLAHFETPLNPFWRYHAAAVIDGIVHDLWFNEPIPLDEYMDRIRAVSVEYPSEEPA